MKYTRFLLTGNVVDVDKLDSIHIGPLTPVVHVVSIIVAISALGIITLCLPVAAAADGTRAAKLKYIMLKRKSSLN